MLIQSIHPPSTPPSSGDSALMAASRELEAQFLSEMLKAASLGDAPEGFGGGAGEEQFSSFLRMEQARAITQSGGIGLAETIFHALKERQDG
ncbi:rod-binding protein [Primorskyibacter marinus]|uniref:rod-binding protein n=1 Tax=Primorskyibacter marinus TaxID=1977320 RepID=UPI000E2FFEBC|nr:rod-binding protein [Primorskyibacter marinus]